MHQKRLDSDVLRDGRKNVLKDDEDLKVVVDLRDQVVKKLLKKLEDQGEGLRTRELWLQGNALRTDWLSRQQELLLHYDEFVEPIYNSTQDWSSTLHLPVVLTMCKTYHARFLAALLAIDPPFTVKARQSANVDRAHFIQEFMRYTLHSWVNVNQGIEEVADAWLWSWVTQGRGILKSRWERRFTRYVDVVERQEQAGQLVVPDEQGQLTVIPQMRTVEEEKEVVINTFDGPMVEYVPNEDIMMIGGNESDPQECDHVLHSTYMTASQLWSLVDQGIFRKEAVEKVVEFGENLRSADVASAFKSQQVQSSGMGALDNELDEKRYHVIERHSRIVVDDSGIASDIIMFVHGETGEILRATYLYRVSKTGLRPFFSIDFHKRSNGMPAGLPELLYSLAKEIDAVHNMRIDFGILSSMPFGFYRATSSLSEEKMPLEPGVMLPLDNPQTDVFFPNLGNRTAFTQQEEQTLYSYIERMTAMSDMSLGIIGGQGAARTATGARALLGESNANLDVYLRRMNRGWKRVLHFLFHQLQERTPPGFMFRVIGDDGSMYWETIKDRKVLQGQYDFELEPSSANSNKTVQIEQANAVLQTVANPFFIQLGIVTQIAVFNALRTKFMVEGVRDWSKYLRKPQGQMRLYTPEEIANSVLAGVDIKLGPEQDLQGFLEYFEYIVSNDEILGQFTEQQTVLLAMKAKEAEQMLQAMQAQQAQMANAAQMQMNASMGAPTPQGAGAGQAPPSAAPAAE